MYNRETGAVNISGGTVQATTSAAVYNVSTGKITVSQAAGATTKITSANTYTSQGTIYLSDNTTTAGVRLEITGGKVENTAANGYAIYNSSNTPSQITIDSSAVISGGKCTYITY